MTITRPVKKYILWTIKEEISYIIKTGLKSVKWKPVSEFWHDGDMKEFLYVIPWLNKYVLCVSGLNRYTKKYTEIQGGISQINIYK